MYKDEIYYIIVVLYTIRFRKIFIQETLLLMKINQYFLLASLFYQILINRSLMFKGNFYSLNIRII